MPNTTRAAGKRLRGMPARSASTAPSVRSVGEAPPCPAGTVQRTRTPATMAATATAAVASRQPNRPPSQLDSGTPSSVATVMPPNTVPSARPWCSGVTRLAPAAEAIGPTKAPPVAISMRDSATSWKLLLTVASAEPRASSISPVRITRRRGRPPTSTWSSGATGA